MEAEQTDNPSRCMNQQDCRFSYADFYVPPSGSKVKNSWSYTIHFPQRFYGVDRASVTYYSLTVLLGVIKWRVIRTENVALMGQKRNTYKSLAGRSERTRPHMISYLRVHGG